MTALFLLLAAAVFADPGSIASIASKSQLDRLRPRFSSREKEMSRPPDADLGPAKAWVIEKSDHGAMYIRLDGTLPLHRHPDGAHRIYVLSGKIRLTSGTQEAELSAGDFALIPIGVAHETTSVDGPAVYASIDFPRIDPKKIVWLKGPPGAKP